MFRRGIWKFFHWSVLLPMIRHPPRLIHCEICGCTRIQVRTAPSADIGSRCLSCHGTGRHRSILAVARGLFGQRLEKLHGGSVYEVSAHGALHRAFARLAPEVGFSITFSELDGRPLGTMLNGIRCENLEHLTFPDGQFDLITSTDVMEHVENDIQAYREIARVLRSSGYYVFTVPFYEAPTVIRAERAADGTIKYLHPPEFHSDPWNPVGIFTWRCHGPDVIERLALAGLTAEVRSVSVSGISDPQTVIVAHGKLIS